MLIAVLAVLAAWAAWRLPETVDRAGRRLTLTPRMPTVPRSLWRIFGLSALGVLAAWSVGGLYLALGPGLISELTGTENHAIGGLFVFAVCARATLAQWVLRASEQPHHVRRRRGRCLQSAAWSPRPPSRAGSLAGLVLGSLVVGLGFGAAFTGALRSLASALPPAHRAGVMSAFFVVAYTAISIPAIGAGVAAVHIGLELGGYLVWRAVSIVALLVVVIGWFELRPEVTDPDRASLRTQPEAIRPD